MSHEQDVRLSKWLGSNQELLGFIDPFVFPSDGTRESLLSQKRQGIHARSVTDLTVLLEDIQTAQKRITAELEQIGRLPVPPISERRYDDPSYDMPLFQVVFTRRMMTTLRTQSLSDRIGAMMHHQENARSILKLLTSPTSPLPPRVAIRLKPEFFQIQDQPSPEFQRTISILTSYIERKQADIRSFRLLIHFVTDCIASFPRDLFHL